MMLYLNIHMIFFRVVSQMQVSLNNIVYFCFVLNMLLYCMYSATCFFLLHICASSGLTPGDVVHSFSLLYSILLYEQSTIYPLCPQIFGFFSPKVLFYYNAIMKVLVSVSRCTCVRFSLGHIPTSGTAE